MEWVLFFAVFISALLAGILTVTFWAVRRRSAENIPALLVFLSDFLYSATLLGILFASIARSDLASGGWIYQAVPFHSMALITQMFMGTALLYTNTKITGRIPIKVFIAVWILELALAGVFLGGQAGFLWPVWSLGFLSYGLALLFFVIDRRRLNDPRFRIMLFLPMLSLFDPTGLLLPILVVVQVGYSFYYVLWIMLTKGFIQHIERLNLEVERRKLAEIKVNDLNMELLQAYDTTLEGWSRALELRDKETEGHSQRVTELALQLGRACGLSEEDLVYLRYGALLHDIGKMAVPDHILNKPGPLSTDERTIIECHPITAYEMLKDIKFLQKAVVVPRHHHERWDGSGYPDRLAGEAIPILARIFSIVDCWDALLMERSYRAAWLKVKVVEHLDHEKGGAFDANLVEVFLSMVIRN